MKRNYTKPNLYLEKLAMNPVVATCANASAYWSPLEQEGFVDGYGNTATIFVPEVACSHTDAEFSEEFGVGDDNNCYVSSVDDGKTFS